MQEWNLNKLLKTIGNVEVNDKENHTLIWLSRWPAETVDNICSIIEKVKGVTIK